MRTRYLLPCSCGQKIPIEPRQAGEVISCDCGASQNAPTMREMTRLEEAAPDPTAGEAATWGVRQAIVLLGGIMLVVAIVPAVFLYLEFPTKPKPPTVESIREDAATSSPLVALKTWHLFRAGGPGDQTDDGIGAYGQSLNKFQEKLLRWRVGAGASLALIALGAGLIIGAVLTGRSKM